MTKRLLWITAKYGLGLGLLAYVVWRNWSSSDGRPGLADALGQPIQAVPLLLASLICTASLLLTFLRWYVLVWAQELPFTPRNAIRLGLIGYFWSTFLPGSVGGDIVKAAFLARDQRRRTVAVATVLIDRAVGLWGLFWLVAILGSVFWLASNEALHQSAFLQTVYFSSLAIVAGSVLCWALLGILPAARAARLADWLEHRIPRLGHSLAELWRAVWMYRLKRAAVALALAMSVVGHVGFVLTFYYAAQIFLSPTAAADIPSLEEHFLIVPVGMTIQAGFPAPGGVGGGELAYGWLYEQLHKPESAGVLGSLAQRAVNWLLALAGYLAYLRLKPALPARLAPEPSADGQRHAPAAPNECSLSGQ